MSVCRARKLCKELARRRPDLSAEDVRNFLQRWVIVQVLAPLRLHAFGCGYACLCVYVCMYVGWSERPALRWSGLSVLLLSPRGSRGGLDRRGARGERRGAVSALVPGLDHLRALQPGETERSLRAQVPLSNIPPSLPHHAI